MQNLDKYLKNTKKANLKKLEEIVESFVLDPVGQQKKYDIKIRKNTVFGSKCRIVPERESRKIETISLGFKTMPSTDCFFCDPKNKGAKFAKETGLEQQYYLNESSAFSNLFTFAKIHGVVIFDYKQHLIDPRGLKQSNWIDSMKLVQKIGKASKRKYVSFNVNFGFKAGASLEHFHGQFVCEDEPLAKTSLAMNLGNKKYWKSWVKALFEKGLVVDFDKESKTVLFVEWSPAFSKTEFVVMNLENPCFQNMNENEIKDVAKFLDKAIKITIENVSDQFNIVNLSASSKDNFCNQFRIFPRAPSSHGVKSWEGFLEFSGETVPHISPEKLADIAKKY
ncbi:hypothetical protein A3K64_02410 [Candidatus Micrarchaeota archaeon RBG_16_36_9]|nr:MAG: hypothetical protein A3K64_02410 [Candidatus Micrarchaeota archaeon RBG_16_36_9]